MPTARPLAAIILLTALSLGCSRDRTPPELPAEKPPTADVEAFGRAMAAAMNDGCDPQATAALVDAEALSVRISRAMKGKVRPDQLVPKMKSGLRGEMSLCMALGPGGVAHFLRVREVDGAQRALIRVTGEGLTYIEFVVTRRDGKVWAADYYPYGMGSMMSEMLARTFEQIMAPGYGGMLKTKKAFDTANAAAARGDYAEARAALDQMPDEMRHTKTTLLVEIGFAANLDDEIYKGVLADFARRFPGDPSLDLVELDGHIMRKDHAALLRTTDRLDARVGGDPLLDTMRAMAKGMTGDVAGAEALYEKAAKATPETDDALWGLASLYLEHKRFDKLDGVWARLEAEFETEPDLDLIRDDALYAEYLASPQGQALVARLEGRSGGAAANGAAANGATTGDAPAAAPKAAEAAPPKAPAKP